MIDKNPYEKDDVNVPNFSNQETNGNEPIFDMDTTSVTSQTDSFDPMEEAESSSKTAIIVLIAFLILFLIGSISGWIFGISKSKEVSTLQADFDKYKETSKKQISDLETQISELQVQIQQGNTATNTDTNTDNNATSGGTTSTDPGTKTEANTYYLMQEGVTVRTGAGTSNAPVNYDSLPTDIKNIVNNVVDKDNSKNNTVTTRSAKFPVYETKTVDNKNWGRIADGAWVCIDFGTKQ